MLTERLSEQAEIRQTLDRRFDDIESGRVALIPGDQVRARMRERSEAYRAKHGE
jgi:putative addiction module component (TIGR02574 family)